MPVEGHCLATRKDESYSKYQCQRKVIAHQPPRKGLLSNLAAVQLVLALFTDYIEKKHIETICSTVYVCFQKKLWLDKNPSKVT